jgi:type I restriction enzyme S subunit
VTKGLDSDVEMKDSGVEWLGDIPAAWEAVRIKSVAELHSGHTPDKKVAAYWDDGTIPWVSLADSGFLWLHRYIDKPKYYTTPEGIANSSAVVLPARSVILSRDATVGLCAIATTELAVSQHFMAWVCGPAVLDEYLLYVIDAMKQELERLSMGSTIPTIGLPHIKDLAMPLPPVDEQHRIVDRIAGQTGHIDSLVERTRQSIDLLQEYRTALISAAVTGQIDIPATDAGEDVA